MEANDDKIPLAPTYNTSTGGETSEKDLIRIDCIYPKGGNKFFSIALDSIVSVSLDRETITMSARTLFDLIRRGDGFEVVASS